MASRRDRAEEEVVALFGDVVAGARVFQGGGTELTTTSSLRDSFETAAKRSLIRLFPKFAQGDNPNWGKVITKAREGAPDALTAVGHHGEPTTHPVCKEVLAAISPGGTRRRPPEAVRRTAVRLAEGRRERGRPRSARGRNIRAAQDGKDLGSPKELPQTQIGKVTLYKEDAPPSASQRLAVRGLLTAAGSPYEPGQEGAQLPALLQQLKDLAARAGGAPPLPEAPDTDHLDALLALAGTSASARSPTIMSASAPTSNAGEPLQHAVKARDRMARPGACSATPTGCRWPRLSHRRSPPSVMVANSSTSPIRSHRSSPSSSPPCEAEVTQRAQQLADAARAGVQPAQVPR